MKKDLKIDESEVMELLNDDLKNTITIYMNGKILKSVSAFSIFPLEFLSNFNIDENVFNEGDDGKVIYFIT